MAKPNKAWLVLAGAAAVAAIGGLAGAEGYLGIMAVLFLLAASAVGAMVLFDHPFLGFAVLVLAGVVFPVEFPGPAGVRMSGTYPLAALLCGVWLLRVVLVRRAALDDSRVVYAAVAFIAITLLSFAMGQFPWYPAGAPMATQIAELGLFLVSVCLFLAVGHQLKSVAQLKWLTWILVAAGVVAVAIQSSLTLAYSVGEYTTRPASVGSLFYTWLVAVTFAQALFNRTLPVWARLFLLGVTALVMFHGLFQVRSWASGWAPPLLAAGLITMFRFPRFSVGVGLVALPAVLLFGGETVTALLQGEEYSVLTREAAWVTLMQIVERSPLLGTGPANYYYYTENLPLLGWYVRFIAHNNYQDLLVQTGVIGLLSFCWFAFEALWLTLHVYRRVPAGFAKAYAVGALGGAVGSLASGMLGDWIIPFYYNAGILGFRSSLLFWVFLGGVLTLKRLAANPVAAEAVASGKTGRLARGYRKLAEAH